MVLGWQLAIGNRQLATTYRPIHSPPMPDPSAVLVMVEDCPTCGHHFEREQGYWIGAMIVATAFTLAGFLATFVGGLVTT